MMAYKSADTRRVFTPTYRIPDTTGLMHLSDFIYMKPSALLHVSVHLPRQVRSIMQVSSKLIRDYMLTRVDKSQLIWLREVNSVPNFLRFEIEFCTLASVEPNVKQLDGALVAVEDGPTRHQLRIRAAAARHQHPPRRAWMNCCGDNVNGVIIQHALYLRGLPKCWFPCGGCGSVVKRSFCHWGNVMGVDVTASLTQPATLDLRVRFDSHDGFHRAMNTLGCVRLAFWNHTLAEAWLAPIFVDLGDENGTMENRRWPDFLPAPVGRLMPAPNAETEYDTSPEREKKVKLKEHRKLTKQLKSTKRNERSVDSRISYQETRLLTSQRRLESLRLLEVIFNQMKFSDSNQLKGLRSKLFSTFISHQEKQLEFRKNILLKTMKEKHQLRKLIDELSDIVTKYKRELGTKQEVCVPPNLAQTPTAAAAVQSQSAVTAGRKRAPSHSDNSSCYSRSRSRSSYSSSSYSSSSSRSRSSSDRKSADRTHDSSGSRSPGSRMPRDPRVSASARGSTARGNWRGHRPFRARIRGRGFAPLLYDVDGNEWKKPNGAVYPCAARGNTSQMAGTIRRTRSRPGPRLIGRQSKGLIGQGMSAFACDGAVGLLDKKMATSYELERAKAPFNAQEATGMPVRYDEIYGNISNISALYQDKDVFMGLRNASGAFSDTSPRRHSYSSGSERSYGSRDSCDHSSSQSHHGASTRRSSRSRKRSRRRSRSLSNDSIRSKSLTHYDHQWSKKKTHHSFWRQTNKKNTKGKIRSDVSSDRDSVSWKTRKRNTVYRKNRRSDVSSDRDSLGWKTKKKNTVHRKNRRSDASSDRDSVGWKMKKRHEGRNRKKHHGSDDSLKHHKRTKRASYSTSKKKLMR